MTELIRVIVLGVIATGVIALFALIRSLHRQIDDLRTEVAIARIEGVLSGTPTAPVAAPAPRERLQQGVCVLAGAAVGALTTAAVWLVSG
ncbi:hypothetical protein ACFUJR_27645 [Streptomyces sp. NPDC057271]|uniref:hypothetical protein n=1 Tax=unclassified Streptomyces TaxID=2593676 RepID=UPI0036257AC8